MQLDLKKSIDAVGKEKNIDPDTLYMAVQEGLLAVVKKMYGADCTYEVKFIPETDEVIVYRYRRVVKDSEIKNEGAEIRYSEAIASDPSLSIGDEVGELIDTSALGRIDATLAKQRIIEKLHEAEKEKVFREFRDKKGEIVNGIVRRFDKKDIIVDLGGCEAILPEREQIPQERFKPRDKILCYVSDVKKSSRGPQVLLSRTSPLLVVKLFEQEVTEIAEGTVVIRSSARDPGRRTKIAVYSTDSAVDPIGACVGLKGSRVQAVIAELRNEKVDIILFDADPARFVCNALAPAEVSKVIVNERTKTMEVVVPDEQLPQAIGQGGRNVRLAAQLTGWRVDIRSETTMRDLTQQKKNVLAQIPILGEMRAEILVNEGYKEPYDVAQLEPRVLVKLLRLSVEEAQQVIQGAEDIASSTRRDDTEEAFGMDDLLDDTGATFTEEEEQAAIENLATKVKVAALIEPDKLDVKQFPREGLNMWMRLRGVGEVSAAALLAGHFDSYEALAQSSVEDIAHRTGLPLRFSGKLKDEAAQIAGI